jgi:predicted metal-dependent hydrolase
MKNSEGGSPVADFHHSLPPYGVEFGRRKTLQISVHPDGRVTVKALLFLDRAAVDRAVEEKREWIGKKLDHFRSLPAPAYRPPLGQGSPVPFLGQLYPDHISEGQRFDALIEGGALRITLRKGTEPEASLPELLNRWYSARAAEEFPLAMKRCLPMCSSFLKEGPLLRIRTMRSRWGSCTGKGVVTLNTLLVKASPACIDYVLLHELCHTVHHNHGKGFYSLLESILPGWKDRKRELLEQAKCRHFI